LVDEQFQRIRRLFQITHQLTIPRGGAVGVLNYIWEQHLMVGLGALQAHAQCQGAADRGGNQVLIERHGFSPCGYGLVMRKHGPF
jgi:hypothetical protein